ncbi:branched-chain amino acid ABC transporter permease [Thermodesulfovibrio hydrogeniphilus]
MAKRDYISLLIFALLILCFPVFVQDNYILTVTIFAAINSLVALGLTILMGYAGQISLGQAGFYGIGAYISAILSLNFGLPVVFSMFLSVIVSALISILLAIPALRLKGHYLAVATLGFGEIIYVILNEWGPGGPSGFGDIPQFSFLGYTMSTLTEYFYLSWFFVGLCMIFSMNLINSMAGKALKSIHDSETASVCIGINVSKLKIKVFVLSAIFASLAGCIYAHFVTFLSPSTFSLHYSILVLMMVIIGGMRSLWGAVVGALIITFLPEALRGFKEYDILVYGIVLTLSLLFLRNGIVPLIEDLFRKKA